MYLFSGFFHANSVSACRGVLVSHYLYYSYLTSDLLPLLTLEVSRNIQDLIANSVTPGTRYGHLMAWHVWVQFIDDRIPPLDLYLFDMTHRERVMSVLDFIVWLNGDGRRTGAIQKILSGVKFMFKCNAVSQEAIDDSSIRSAMSGLGASDSSIDLKKAPSQSLLWALPLHNYARCRFWLSSHLDYKMTYIAAAIGFNFSLRIGEIAKSATYNKAPKFFPDHRFYFCDICLEDSLDPNVTYSFSKYKSISPRPIISVVIFVKNSSKTSGRIHPDGKPYFLGPVGSAEEIEIFHDFIDWMELCGHNLDEEPIASRLHPTTQKFKRATAKEITMMLREVGADHDLEGFTGKSLRGGASSAFTAAGYSDSVILNSVGHKSLPSNQHYQSGSLSANKYALGTGEVISITDVRRTQAIIKLTKDPKTKRA